jgi:hypothetical protein
MMANERVGRRRRICLLRLPHDDESRYRRRRGPRVLDAILPAYELADQQIEYLRSPSLRIPAKLLISARE